GEVGPGVTPSVSELAGSQPERTEASTQPPAPTGPPTTPQTPMPTYGQLSTKKGVVTDLRTPALQELGPATWERGTEGRYADALRTGPNAQHVYDAIQNLVKRYPSLQSMMPEMLQAISAHPPSRGTWAAGIMREPDTGIVIPTPDVIGRW